MDKKIEEALGNSNIPISLLKNPYSFMSTNELEQVAQVIQEVDTNKFFYDKNSDSEKYDWTFGSYLSDTYEGFRRKCKSLFEVLKEFDVENLR